MIYFIIYEDNIEIIDKYRMAITKIMGDRGNKYTIVEANRYNRKIQQLLSMNAKKIYILDVEVPGRSGIDLARDIRKSGDWESQIIIITTHDSLQQNVFMSKLLTLNFISKFNNFTEELKETIAISYMILTNHDTLRIKYNGEFQQYYYNDILFIMRKPEDIESTIVLSDGSSKPTTYTLAKLEGMLENDPRFFRTHRGCIVNVFRITNVDFINGIIYFDKHKTSMLARERKKLLKETLRELSPTVINEVKF